MSTAVVSPSASSDEEFSRGTAKLNCRSPAMPALAACLSRLVRGSIGCGEDAGVSKVPFVCMGNRASPAAPLIRVAERSAGPHRLPRH